MKPLILRLLVILVAQCLIVVAVFWPPNAQSPEGVPLSLTQFTADTIRRISISDEQGRTVNLQRSGNHWLLAAMDGMEADAAMVQRLLQIATEPAARWPIANTDSAQQRFSVAQDTYKRRIVFATEGAEQATVLLGTSPGYQRVHARNIEQDAIHSIDFNIFEAPTRNNQWLSPDLLQVRSPLSIVAESYSVSFNNGIWRSGSGGTPDKRELQALLDTLRNMQTSGTASENQVDTLAASEPEFTFTIESLTGTTDLAFFKLEREYFVRSSKYPYFFISNAYDVDRLAGIDFSLIAGSP